MSPHGRLTQRSRPFRHRSAVPLLAGLVVALAACQPLGSGTEASTAPSASAGGSTQPSGSPVASVGGEVIQLSIATGGTGGVYYPLGGGISQVIRAYVPGYDATVQETNASVDNMQLIASGGADLAFALADTAADAVAGKADFEGKAVTACAIGRLYNNFTQVVTSADTGITSIEGLRGKRVSLGSPGSGTEVIALRILEAAGIDPNGDIKRAQLGIAETVDALKDGTIDVGFWSGGLPTGALVDLATTGKMVLIPTGAYTAALQSRYGESYIEDVIPAGAYDGQAADVSTVVVPNVLVANVSMPKELQQQITAAIFDHKNDLVAVHKAASALDPSTAGDVGFMDVCPGSQAYYAGH